ncbi:MAG: hypothetical protein L6R45_08375 [Anaerolineae bacterium]|nr:hypothetical protein [Anaerolineae bacterium]
MNLDKRVIKQLEQLVTKGPKQVEAVILNSAQQQGYIVGVPAEAQGPSASITLEAYDRYSVALRQLEVSHEQSTLPEDSDPVAYLRRCAERAVQRLTYLEEPLILLELDPAEKLAQLRSDPPRQEGEKLTYWEVFIRATPHLHVRLSRYRWQPDKPEREQITYPATFATLGRIAQDLALSIIEE